MKPRISTVYEGMYTPSALASGGSTVTKRIALASTLLVPASAPGRAALAWGGRQAVVRTGTAIQAMVTDPLGVMQGTNRMLSTYKRATQVVGAYNYFNEMRNYKSSGSSSRAYQQNGSPGGTRPSKKSGSGGAVMYRPRSKNRKGWKSGRRGPCRPGYLLDLIEGYWMCILQEHHKHWK